jgi:hypothetical protein
MRRHPEDTWFAGQLLILGVGVVLGVIAWYVTKQDALLAIVLGLLQVVFALQPGTPAPPPDETAIRALCVGLHRSHKRAWDHLAVRRHLRAFLGQVDGPTALFPPRVNAWPTTARPFQTGLVTRDQITAVVNDLVGNGLGTAVIGAEDVGKSVFQLLLLLEAQRVKDTGGSAFPLRISLAQWPLGVDDRPASLPLRTWVARRITADYPNLNLSPSQARAVVDWLWEPEPAGGHRRLLFLDGIDELKIDEQARGRLLDRLLDDAERGAGPVVVACREGTWQHCTAARDWPQIQLSAPDAADIHRFIDSTDWLRYLTPPDAPDAPRNPNLNPIRRSLRLLQLVADIYGGRNPICPTPPSWLADPPTQPSQIQRLFWDDVIAQVAWPVAVPSGGPGGPGGATTIPATTTTTTTVPLSDRRDFVATVAWLNGHRAFAGSGSAWWRIPRQAEADPALVVAVRRAKRHRWLSVLGWTCGAWLSGTGLLLLALRGGAVQGYPHGDGGLGPARGLSLADLHSWRWVPDIAGLLANPLYAGLLSLLAVLGVMTGLCLLGGEFEDPGGGHPQMLQFTTPSARDLRNLGVSRWVLFTLLATTIVAVVMELGGSALAGPFLGLVAVTWSLTAVLGWLIASTRAAPDSLGGAPFELFDRDRAASKIVAFGVAGTGGISATAAVWAVTTGGQGLPSLTAFPGIVASVALFVGVGRGFLLGAGMGFTRVVPLRAGFGIGYAARLTLLEQAATALTSQGERVRMRWTELFGLHREQSREAVPQGVPIGAVVPAVGSRLQLRDSSLSALLDQAVPTGETTTEGRPPGPIVRRLRTAAALGTVITMLAVVTGATAVFVPRLPCGGFTDLGALWRTVSDPASPSQVTPTVWLENGQCVGFVVPGLQRYPSSGLTAPSGPRAASEKELDNLLDRVAKANRKATEDGRTPVTVVFLAPLSRTNATYAINALWQLEGVTDALERINGPGSPVRARLVVANAGENFVSGAGVVRELQRVFRGSGDRPGIDAVIGIAQSRASAREALVQFGDKVQIVAASVYGTQLKRGLGNDQRTPLTTFTAIAPSDEQIAALMVSQARQVAGRARGLAGRTTGLAGGEAGNKTPKLGLIYDDADPYFSVDLNIALRNQVVQQTGTEPIQTIIDSEVGGNGRPSTDQRTRENVDALCQPDRKDWVWLYAGRGNRWTTLDGKLRERPNCRPHVVGGPGTVSAVAASPDAGQELNASDNLSFLSLVGTTEGGKAEVTAEEVAQGTDRALGEASLLAVDALQVPRTCLGGQRSALGLKFDDETGHNTLAQGPDEPCSREGGSQAYFCTFAHAHTPDAARCSPAPDPSGTRPVPPPAPSLRAVVNRPPGNPQAGLPVYREPRATGSALGVKLPWESPVTVRCLVPRLPQDAVADDAWLGITTPASGSGFIRWRYHGRDLNVYLRFPELPGPLARGEWTSLPLPTTLPSCADNGELVALIDHPNPSPAGPSPATR